MNKTIDPKINIIITEDKLKWRNVMKGLLKKTDINILAEAEHGAELLRHLENLNPDVILLDLEMPVMDGTETMRWLTEKHPNKKVMIMSQFDDSTLMEDYKMRGVKGCFPKSEVGFRVDDLVSAIRIIHEGGTYFDFDQKPVKITIRQKELVTLFGDQKTNTEIAAHFNISTSAVAKQKQKIMKIFGIKTLSDFYKKIYTSGLNYFRRSWRNDNLGKII